MLKRIHKGVWATLWFWSFIIGVVYGHEDTTYYKGRKYGNLQGLFLDADTGEPVGGVQVLLREVHRSAISNSNGMFSIKGIPEGQYSLHTFRIGYRAYHTIVMIIAADTQRLILSMKAMPLSGEIILIETDREKKTSSVVLEMSGIRLRQNLGQTIAQTVANEPGMDQRTMGPAPARPVLRGMSGDRLLILEDKGRTGDLSATSADHAVAIDPITADKIQVIRGPETLIYGPNTLGGVINVERGMIPSFIPDRWYGSFSLQAESVNRGIVLGTNMYAKSGPLVIHADGSYRNAGDIHTPAGVLKNTSIHTINFGAGVSRVGNDGYLGAAGMWYQSDYGIPGGFTGAHPKGVRVELDRKRVEARWDRHFDHPWFDHTQLDYAFTNYFHRELESDGSVGTQFSVLSYHLTWRNHLPANELFRQRTFGLWGEFRSYVPGGYIFTPDTREVTVAGFYYQHLRWNQWAWYAAFRSDFRVVQPSENKFSKIGHIRRRSFLIASGATAIEYYLTHINRVGFRIMRSGRMPGIEELFSEGPHLAAYSFEVGDPDLQPESGLGTEIYSHLTYEKWAIDLSVFRNDMHRYLFPRNTGALHIASNLPVYQYSAVHAVIEGAEGLIRIFLPASLQWNGMISYSRGYRYRNRQPLPFMPPLTWKSEITGRHRGIQWSLLARGAGAQNRVDEFETPTHGYLVMDVNIQWSYRTNRLLHTLVIAVENVMNTEYRRHLSRVRLIMPEPGRNIKLLYKIFL